MPMLKTSVLFVLLCSAFAAPAYARCTDRTGTVCAAVGVARGTRPAFHRAARRGATRLLAVAMTIMDG